MVHLKNFKFFTRWSILGSLIGVVSGFGAIGFFLLLQICSTFFLGYVGGYVPASSGGEVNPFAMMLGSVVTWRIPLILVLGGLVSGFIVYRFGPEAEGHGTDAYISSFHYKNGAVRKRIPLIKAVSSAIVIGSGGSAGREGPIAQIGSGFGSFIASRLNLSNSDKRIAIICGAAGGIGAIFKAPLGGAIFAIEVLYKRDIEAKALLPAFISSIVAYAIFGIFLGFEPIFTTHVYAPNIISLFLFAILGLACALFAIIFIKVFYFIKDTLFKKLKVSRYFKPAIGCLIVGGVSLFFPEVLGPGYGLVQLSLDEKVFVFYLFLLIFAKIIVTSFTIGSGGSGGVFAPSLVIGASIGGFISLFIKLLVPTLEVETAAFVVVGMASFITAVANVPIASIIMVSEMTNTYSLLPAAMVACTVSYILTTKWSIYESQVLDKTYSPVHRGEYTIDVLQKMKVGDIMNTPVQIVHPEDALQKVSEIVQSSGHSGFPVIDENQKLVGIIVYRDLFKSSPETMTRMLVKDVMSQNLVTINPDQNVLDALDKIENYGFGRLPVVDPQDASKLLGIITKRDILHAREVRRRSLMEMEPINKTDKT
jgi:CIC family chloride channel protein